MGAESTTVFKVLFWEVLAELTVLVLLKMMAGRRSGTNATPPIFSITSSNSEEEEGVGGGDGDGEGASDNEGE